MLKLMIKYAMVGLCGVGINMLVFNLLTVLGINYLLAAACSFAVAVTNNFIWNARWTFKERVAAKSMQRKYISFVAISTATLGFNLIMLGFLVGHVHIGETLAQLIAIALVSGLNFILNYWLTFSSKHSNQRKETLKAYETDYNTNI